jgi:hypothetical protein
LGSVPVDDSLVPDRGKVSNIDLGGDVLDIPLNGGNPRFA